MKNIFIPASLWFAVQEACWKRWDPIGVNQVKEASDEYDSYVKPICEMLILKKSEEQIFDFLWKIETEHMGLDGDAVKTKLFAEQLLKFENCERD